MTLHQKEKKKFNGEPMRSQITVNYCQEVCVRNQWILKKTWAESMKH